MFPVLISFFATDQFHVLCSLKVIIHSRSGEHTGVRFGLENEWRSQTTNNGYHELDKLDYK